MLVEQFFNHSLHGCIVVRQEEFEIRHRMVVTASEYVQFIHHLL